MQSHVIADTGSILIAFFPNGLGLAQELFVIELVADHADELVASLLLQDLVVFAVIKNIFLGSDIIVDLVGRPCQQFFIALVAVRTNELVACLLYTSPSPRDLARSRMPSSA